MASTTNAKKEVIDFLWEWAEGHGDWAKLLVDNILASGTELASSERSLIFQYFLQSLKLHSGLPALSIKKPTFTPPVKSVLISSLSEVTGVNRLAKNQVINFSKNMTVIYGENGTGKTGYSRILKALGFSYETSGTIFPNIYSVTEPKSAKIEYEVGTARKTFTWNGTNRDTDLESVSVFNNHCVPISLADRQLVVTPLGFELFNLISDELNVLAGMLNSEKQKYSIIDYSTILTFGTPQFNFISKLSKDSSLAELKTIATFSEDDDKKLNNDIKALAALNKSLIEASIQTLRLQISEIDNVISKISKTQSILNDASWNELVTYNEEIKQLQSQTQKGLSEIIESYEVESYQSNEFKSFLTSAEKYIKILTNIEYPQQGDKCIYCQQTLSKEAVELIANYRALLNDQTEAKLNAILSKKNHFKAQSVYLDSDVRFQQPVFGYDQNSVVMQPELIEEYNKIISGLKKLIHDDNVSKDVYSIDYNKYLTFCREKKQTLVEQQDRHQTSLSELTTREQSLKKEIDELKDRKILASKYQETVKNIDNLKIVDRLNNNANSFNTRSISLKTSEARDELVKHNFNSIFKSELHALRKSHLDIDLNFATDRGSSRVIQKVKAHNLIDILSEGEQKAIALAEFLTELQLDNVNSSVVFDDPVNSLDHHIVDDFARRAITLSKSRQVIIFTHSILLFNSLLYFSGQPSYKDILFLFYNAKNNYTETGVITSADEINSLKSYIGQINVLLNGAKDRPENELAEDGYGFLRSAIELFVEFEVFNGTIKRYQKNVALTSFVKINGKQLDAIKDKLNEIFERCCGYIKGHSNPMDIHNDPTLKGLQQDFEEFKSIRKQFMA